MPSDAPPALTRAWLTTSQVAARLGVDPTTVKRWTAQGALCAAFVTPGGHRRYRLEDVDALATPDVA